LSKIKLRERERERDREREREIRGDMDTHVHCLSLSVSLTARPLPDAAPRTSRIMNKSLFIKMHPICGVVLLTAEKQTNEVLYTGISFLFMTE
jgi:hypothetical protein